MEKDRMISEAFEARIMAERLKLGSSEVSVPIIIGDIEKIKALTARIEDITKQLKKANSIIKETVGDPEEWIECDGDECCRLTNEPKEEVEPNLRLCPSCSRDWWRNKAKEMQNKVDKL